MTKAKIRNEAKLKLHTGSNICSLILDRSRDVHKEPCLVDRDHQTMSTHHEASHILDEKMDESVVLKFQSINRNVNKGYNRYSHSSNSKL